MPLVGEVGILQTHGLCVDWIIGDFPSLSDKVGDFYTSPLFSLADSRWCLVLSTNGVSGYPSSEGWVGLHLRRMDPGHPQRMGYTFGIKRSDGVEKKIELEAEFSTKDEARGFGKCWPRSELRDKKATFLPNDVLTVTCELRSGPLSVVKACADNGLFEKDVESLMGQIKTLQKTVENFELESENYKKKISASEREKSSIAEQYKCLLEEKLTVVSGLEKVNEQLKKEVQSLMEQIKSQKTVRNFELESENYKKQISAVESFGQRKVICLGALLFIVFQIMYFVIRTGLSRIGASL